MSERQGEPRALAMTIGEGAANLPVMFARSPRDSTRIRPKTWLVLAASALFVACSAGPEERLTAARAAASDKDLEAFAKFFTQDSANLLRDMVAAGERSKIRYLKDPFSVLPEGDLEDVLIDGNSAILKVKGRRGSEEIRMFMENDEWSIDLYSLKGLWAPLRGESP